MLTEKPPGGLYAIRNRLSGKAYIGFSLSPRDRVREHGWNLRGNRHPVPGLQADFTHHGAGAFSWISAGACRNQAILRCLEDKVIFALSREQELYNRARHHHGDLIDDLYAELAGCLYIIKHGEYRAAFPERGYP
jgi:hypothetical protein